MADATKETELAEYFKMPYQDGFESVECREERLLEAKSALEHILNKAKTNQPNASVKKVLFEYWDIVEAHNACMPGELMRECCKTFLEAVSQLGLYGKLEAPVQTV